MIIHLNDEFQYNEYIGITELKTYPVPPTLPSASSSLNTHFNFG